ncbi:MAG: serine hydrolase [Blastocatellia bacterium]
MAFIRRISWRRALLMMGVTLGVCVVLNLWLQPPRPRWGIARAAQQPDFSEIDRRLQETISKGTFNGIGLMLVTSDKTLYKKAFGADATETKHLLASATKYPSATTMMTLVDSNLIKLDDPIKKYLPQFGTVRGAITIRQLLAQTHGMPANHPCIPQPAQRNGNGMTLEQCVNQIAQDDSVVFPPGSKQEYMTAISYHILGRIAEVATGKEWAALFKERVADPLEMTTFNYGTPANKNPRIGGGGESAMQDYGNLLQMHLAGGVFKGRRVLSEASVAEMQKDQSGGAPFTPSDVSRGLQYGYGLAWWFDLLNANKQPVQFSIPGAFGAIPWLNREAGYGAFLLVQDALVESWDVYTGIFPILNSMLSATPRAAANVSAASYQSAPLAAESIVSAFGSALATTTMAAPSTPLPVTLAGTTIKVRDSAGRDAAASLFFVSPTQINYLLPSGTANGQATVTITSGAGAVSAGTVQIAAVAPGLFTADASGRGLAAATVLRVKADGAQSFEPVAQFDAAQNKFVAVPIDLGPESDQVFLLLFGTGIRNRSALSAVAAKIGGVDCQAPYAGAQGGFAGLDQINVRLSRSLIGRGEVDAALTVDGQAANTVKVQIK